MAAEQGIEVLAITDHDTTDGIPLALLAAERSGVTVVPGVEISAVAGQEEIHILGYFVDLHDQALQSLLRHTREARRERARQMVARLTALGLPIKWERLLEISGEQGSIGRPHVATTLLEAGLINSWDEAFDLWIGRGCPAYVERYKLAPEEAIHLVRASGGLPVLAHPFIFSRQGEQKAGLDLDHWLPRLQEAGLEGIETYYPHCPRGASRQLLASAVRFGLLITGGSDFHGSILGSGLGSTAVPWAVWEGLERRHRAHRQQRPAQSTMMARVVSDSVDNQVTR